VLIEHCHIRGFRSVVDATLDNLGPFVVLYGQNGAGKSNILAAIRAGFDVLAEICRIGGDTRPEPVALASSLFASDFTVGGDAACVIGFKLRGDEQRPLLVLDRVPVLDLSIEVTADLSPSGAVLAHISRFASGDGECEVDLRALLRREDSAIPSWWPLAAVADQRAKHDRLIAVQRQLLIFLAQVSRPRPFRAVSDLRAFGAPNTAARGTGDVVGMLASGDLKGAFAAAHQHEHPEVRDRFARLRDVLAQPPLSLPRFDPVRRASGEVDVQARMPGGGAISIDLAGLGTQQVFYIVASIALEPACCVTLEEPEAHLHAPTSGRALRQLLVKLQAEGMVDQLFVATHSNLFDLDPNGYWHVARESGATTVEPRSDLASIDRDHLWEPGPAKHALADALRYLDAGDTVAHRPDGSPVAASEMMQLLQADDDIAVEFCRDVVGAAVRLVRVRAKAPA